MTHTMTDEEYNQYQSDMIELAGFKSERQRQPERIRQYFDQVKRYVKQYNIELKFPLSFIVQEGCIHGNKVNYPDEYCDMCPVGKFFSECPLGHRKAYSK